MLLVPLSLCVLVAARADDPRARTIAPFVDADLIAVGRVDLEKVDVDKLAHRLVADQELAGEVSQAISPWVAALRKAGAREIYLLLTLPEVMPLHAPPPVLVPLGEGADAKAIGELLCGGGAVKGPIAWPTCATIHKAVFAGSNEALERLRQIKAVERPEVAAAWPAWAKPAPRSCWFPTATLGGWSRRCCRTCPRSSAGDRSRPLSSGLSWTAIGPIQEPEPQVRVVAQGKDAASTKALDELGKKVLQYLRQTRQALPGGPDFAKLADDLKAEVSEDRITVSMDAAKASTWASAILAPMRGSAARSQCINNLKQIGLAMHNYHDQHKSFPPAYTVDKAGKPLLSWRVLILPYLEQNALYKEFHLDEPWDSPHNRTLIDRMPPTYRCPSEQLETRGRGQDDLPDPARQVDDLPGPGGYQDPEGHRRDIEHNLCRGRQQRPRRDLDQTRRLGRRSQARSEGHLRSPFRRRQLLVRRGSVRFIKDSVAAEVLEKLLTRDGGEVIGPDEF